jgi:hypothetical protein
VFVNGPASTAKGHQHDTNMVLSTKYDIKGWKMPEKLRRYEKRRRKRM